MIQKYTTYTERERMKNRKNINKQNKHLVHFSYTSSTKMSISNDDLNRIIYYMMRVRCIVHHENKEFFHF